MHRILINSYYLKEDEWNMRRREIKLRLLVEAE